MAILHSLVINNFRGIKEFKHVFYSDKLICIIGRGDSGKSTILDAIAYVLSSSWNIAIYDSDFYNCDIENPIEIQATLIDLPSFLLKVKYGFRIRGFNPENGKIEDEISDVHEPALTIRLTVGEDLEPSWTVINERNDPVKISASTRSKLNAFLISDYTDSHFSWSKGKPLYNLLKNEQGIGDSDEKNIIIDALREAKQKIDNDSFNDLKGITEKVIEKSKQFGVKLSNTNTTIDFRDISIRDNRVSLHEDKIPYRQKGKGTKRLISMAIQNIIADIGGIVMIDEIEQGLEPDRVKHLVRNIAKIRKGQIIFTTHSQNVIEELDSTELLLIKNQSGNCSGEKCSENFQDVVRACPEAMYANHVIVCEGKTELGICRALDEYRISQRLPSFSELGVIYTLGEGSSFNLRAEKLTGLGKNVCVFCDSDIDDQLKPSKEELKELGISVFDCEANNCTEQQFFNDLNWDGIKELLRYVIEEFGEQSLLQAIKNRIDGQLPDDWMTQSSSKIRVALGLAAKKIGWFKRIDRGEFFGSIYFKNIEHISRTALFNQLSGLYNWIDSE